MGVPSNAVRFPPKVGDPVWVFDENRRVYAKDKDGKFLGGGPIWRAHWEKNEIVSETSRSWILRYDIKVPKKGHNPLEFAFSLADIEEQAFVHENRGRISMAVSRNTDAAKLRTIDLILSAP